MKNKLTGELQKMREMTDLIEEARKRGPMSDAERREQAASFAFGNLALTSQWRDATHEELKVLRERCRRAAGCEGTACKLPPAGWRCSREPGHEGPCAARPGSASEPSSAPTHPPSDGPNGFRGCQRCE